MRTHISYTFLIKIAIRILTLLTRNLVVGYVVLVAHVFLFIFNYYRLLTDKKEEMQEQNGQVIRKTRQNKGKKSSNSQTNADVVNEREDDVSVNQTDNNSVPANSLQTGM